MPSKTIPETITPGELYVPNGRDAFTIEPGGMPNGDACLVVTGPTSGKGNYVAEQTAVLDKHYANPGSTPALTFSFWVKAPPYSETNAIAGIRPDQMMLGCTKTDIAITATTLSASALNNPLGALAWGFFVNAASGASQSNNIAFAATLRGADMITLNFALVPNQWNFVEVFKLNNASAIHYGWLNNVYIGLAQSGYGSGYTTYSATQKFSIGSFSQTTNFGSRAGTWRIGKIAIHSGGFSQLQRNALYNAMLNA